MNDDYTNEDNQQTYPEGKVRYMEREQGIYKGSKEEDFESDKSIKRRKALSGDLPQFETPMPKVPDWEYWSSRFERKSQEYKEYAPNKERHVIIRLPNPSRVSFIGDLHAGNPWTYHDRIRQEIEVIRNTPNSFVVLGGDAIDGFFFNPAQMEQIEQTPEQMRYLRALITTLGEENKLLVAWSGDHDGWQKKQGVDPYTEFAEKVGAYFMHGVGHITFKLEDKEIRLTGAHQLPGSSIYNKAHPATRASKDIQGADIYVNFHTHAKAHLEQSVQLFGGDARWVHMCSAGPYKATDEYSRKKGWSQQNPEEMFGFTLELSDKGIIYHKDILKAHK